MSKHAGERLSADEIFPAVVALTHTAVPGVAGVGVSLRMDERWVPAVASEPFVRRLADLQVELGEGPEVLVVGDPRPVRSDELGADERWPRFGRAAAGLGAHSVMVLPLAGQEAPAGVMSVYGAAPAAFGDRVQLVAGLIARVTALVVQRLWALERAEETVSGLRAAMPSRSVVDQAIGILRSRNGFTDDEALDRLRALSQRSNVRLPEIAASLVDEAMRRARARRDR